MRTRGEPDVDLGIAAAEMGLDRIDDGPDGYGVDGVEGFELAAQDGMHIEEADTIVVEDEISEDFADNDTELEDCIDAFVEAFNAHDLDGLIELLTPDAEVPGLGVERDNFAEAIEDLWDRRPTSLLTRGDLDGRPVAVLWEVGDDGRWWRVAPMLFDGADEGEVGLVELVDDPDALEQIVADEPDGDIDEGMRWEEWEEGVAPD